MNDLLLFTGVVAVWIILNVWILPRLGVPTCMSGGCHARRPAASRRTADQRLAQDQAARDREPR